MVQTAIEYSIAETATRLVFFGKSSFLSLFWMIIIQQQQQCITMTIVKMMQLWMMTIQNISSVLCDQYLCVCQFQSFCTILVYANHQFSSNQPWKMCQSILKLISLLLPCPPLILERISCSFTFNIVVLNTELMLLQEIQFCFHSSH